MIKYINIIIFVVAVIIIIIVVIIINVVVVVVVILIDIIVINNCRVFSQPFFPKKFTTACFCHTHKVKLLELQASPHVYHRIVADFDCICTCKCSRMTVAR